MSHVCVRESSTKEKKPSHTTHDCCSVNRSPADCTCLNRSWTDRQPKTKRLRTRKERSQRRGAGIEASKRKPYHHHCRRHTDSDTAHFQNLFHGSCTSRRDAPFSRVVSTTQEPSIITDSRLIGHHGLFNHEVKSIDIERLLSQQGRLERCGLKAQEENHSSHVPSLFTTNDLLEAGTDEVVPLERKEGRVAKPHIEEGSHDSDITPGQKLQQQLVLSPESYKSNFSSKNSSSDVLKEANSVIRELTPTVDGDSVKVSHVNVKEKVISTPKNQQPPSQQMHARHRSPTPPPLSSSPTTDILHAQHRRQDPNSMWNSVSALGARLCECLQFPCLKSRNLLTESREVLLKALRERHGPWLRENLLYQQQRQCFGTDLTGKVHYDLKPTLTRENDLPSTDASAPAVGPPCSDTTAWREMRSNPFKMKSSLQPQQSLKWNADSLTRPVDTSSRLLDDILTLGCSPRFRMNIEPSGTAGGEHLFTSSPASCWGDKASASQQWDVSLKRTRCKESVTFDSLDNSFSNRTGAFREKRRGPQYNDTQSLFHTFQTQLADRLSPECLSDSFPHHHDLFNTGRFSSFSQISHPKPSSHFQTINQSSPALSFPPLSSYHTDMTHYPPSHMLERGPAPHHSSVPSPEHWCFPPMKLY